MYLSFIYFILYRHTRLKLKENIVTKMHFRECNTNVDIYIFVIMKCRIRVQRVNIAIWVVAILKLFLFFG